MKLNKNLYLQGYQIIGKYTNFMLPQGPLNEERKKNEVKPDYPGGFGDAGAGPYGEAKNSAAGFWGKQDIDRQAKEYDDADDDIGFLKKKRTRYVNGRKVEIPASEPINQRLLTVAQMNDPHYNWEIPQKKTPSVTAVKEEEEGDDKERRFLNPQGLTKSERKAYRDDVVKNISQQMTSECVLRCEKRGVSTGRFIRSPSGELHEVKEEAEEEESEEEEEERPVTPITRRPDWLYNPRRTSAP
ncbi:hypothetical protein Fcan01_20315 [Folsomia candida]|uniref:Uncharacterized protein n=1 Tax=Folsomia candida TaxID=158441 RepID=A0A226DJM2_FOLCA|nr:hypothetical protein Fcan01_20315 [Folsomia candida]